MIIVRKYSQDEDSFYWEEEVEKVSLLKGVFFEVYIQQLRENIQDSFERGRIENEDLEILIEDFKRFLEQKCRSENFM